MMKSPEFVKSFFCLNNRIVWLNLNYRLKMILQDSYAYLLQCVSCSLLYFESLLFHYKGVEYRSRLLVSIMVKIWHATWTSCILELYSECLRFCRVTVMCFFYGATHITPPPEFQFLFLWQSNSLVSSGFQLSWMITFFSFPWFLSLIAWDMSY